MTIWKRLGVPFLGLALLAAACGDHQVIGSGAPLGDAGAATAEPPTPEPQAAKALTEHFTTQTGTLTATTAAQLLDLLTRFKDFTVGVHLLEAPESPPCDAQQQGLKQGTCACNGGGSFTYSVTPTASAAFPSIESWDYVDCESEGVTYQGKLTANVSGDSVTGSATGDRYLLIELTSSNYGRLDAVVKSTSTDSAIAFSVSSAWFVLRDTPDGDVEVTDKTGKWTCAGSTIQGTCTRPGAQPVNY